MLNFDAMETEENTGILEAAIKRAQEAAELQDQVDEYQEIIDGLNARIREIMEKELPEIMEEGGIKDFTLSDGRKVGLKEIVAATMPKEDEQKKRFFGWLSEVDGDDIIKTDVSIPFGKSAHNEALSFAAEVEGRGLPVTVKEGVHTSTLNKFVREYVEAGNGLPPEEVLKVFVGTHAKFTKGKK